MKMTENWKVFYWNFSPNSPRFGWPLNYTWNYSWATKQHETKIWHALIQTKLSYHIFFDRNCTKILDYICILGSYLLLGNPVHCLHNLQRYHTLLVLDFKKEKYVSKQTSLKMWQNILTGTLVELHNSTKQTFDIL